MSGAVPAVVTSKQAQSGRARNLHQHPHIFLGVSVLPDTVTSACIALLSFLWLVADVMLLYSSSGGRVARRGRGMGRGKGKGREAIRRSSIALPGEAG